MIKKEKMKMAAQRAGDLALKLLYPPRCPLCDQIRPVRSTLEWANRFAAEQSEGALPGIRPVRSTLEWANLSGAEIADESGVLRWVCPDCRKKLPWAEEPACMKCGKPVKSPEAEYCDDCARARHLFDRGRAAFTYSGPMRSSVYRMKFQNRRDYLDFYAEAMVCAGGKYLRIWRPEVIVPIPMHRRKRAARGYNQAELLAERIGRLTGIPCDRELLGCVRYTGNQKELNRRERMQNLRGSFEVCRVSHPAAGGGGRIRRLPVSVLLVDDVYTTGSTMDEAARALKEAGVRQIFFLVLCTGKGKKSLHDTKSVLY